MSSTAICKPLPDHSYVIFSGVQICRVTLGKINDTCSFSILHIVATRLQLSLRLLLRLIACPANALTPTQLKETALLRIIRLVVSVSMLGTS